MCKGKCESLTGCSAMTAQPDVTQEKHILYIYIYIYIRVCVYLRDHAKTGEQAPVR